MQTFRQQITNNHSLTDANFGLSFKVCDDSDIPNADEFLSGSELTGIMAANGLGSWKYNLHSQKLTVCSIAAQYLGLKNETISLGNIMRRLAGLQAGKLFKSLKTACVSHTPLNEEIKIRPIDASNSIWLKITGTLFYNGGIAVKMMGTITDITQLKNEENRKMDLMAFLNHELRTPLSTAKLYIQNACRIAKMGKDTVMESRLMRADYQTVLMSGMIDNFLTLSRMEATPLTVNHSHFDLSKMIDEIIADMALMYPQRLFKITLSKSVTVEADQDKIRQVLNNYLTNAIKYSPTESPIKISCKHDRGYVKVAVSDQGAGISLTDQKLLFNRYSRVHDQKQIRVKGFGLGLFLSREIIECHDGNVWVKSQPGKGSIFGFTIPLAASVTKYSGDLSKISKVDSKLELGYH